MKKRRANTRASLSRATSITTSSLATTSRSVKGYNAYQQKAEIARSAGLEGAVEGFMKAASWGTPDKILRGLEERRALLGDFEWNVAFRFGGTPFHVAERGLKLFAEEVLPVLKSW